MQCGIAVRTIARKLVAYIRQSGIASKAINQTRNALPSEAVAFCAANLEKVKGAFKLAESA